MSPQLLRGVVGVILLAHGLGHALTLFPLFGIRLSDSHSSLSPLLDTSLGTGLSSGLCVLLNGAALIGFCLAGMALAGWGVPRELWERLALVAAGISLLGLILFWNSYPFLFPNKVGVLAVDLWALVSILWFRWPGGLFDG